MYQTATVQTIDGKPGVVFPEELVERLKLAEGDVFFVAVHETGLMLTRADLSTKDAVEIYRRGAEKYRTALRELAKHPPAGGTDESHGRG
jgi:bifunctional DNA-binding transcriptional regulator/antitoxin component of YhaV-PrlF toxin-antitoxin module